jgi:hypothetical protein
MYPLIATEAYPFFFRKKGRKPRRCIAAKKNKRGFTRNIGQPRLFATFQLKGKLVPSAGTRRENFNERMPLKYYSSSRKRKTMRI